MPALTDGELLASFTSEGPVRGFLYRFGPLYERGPKPCQVKLCFTSTSVMPMAQVLYELSLRDDCYFVKLDQERLPNGMVRGRCFLGSRQATAEVWLRYKVTAELLCTVQDDGCMQAYRPT